VTAPIGPRVEVDANARQVTVRNPTPVEIADVTQFRTEALARATSLDNLAQRLIAARRKLKRALAAGQGDHVVTVADLAEVFGLDPDPS